MEGPSQVWYVPTDVQHFRPLFQLCGSAGCTVKIESCEVKECSLFVFTVLTGVEREYSTLMVAEVTDEMMTKA